MSTYEKLYKKIKNNPKNVSFHEIDKLLVQVGGFIRRSPRGGSSHYTYSHDDLKEIITIPKDRPIKAVYIKRALAAFDMVKNKK
ncbi:MAG: hypothetical protein GX069_01740 [Tissierellia bacterium]|nr:hypothetical protein [Tissierellia bacterium]